MNLIYVFLLACICYSIGRFCILLFKEIIELLQKCFSYGVKKFENLVNGNNNCKTKSESVKNFFNDYVPFLENTQVYTFPSHFPTDFHLKFYEFFKDEFFNGNYIDLKGNDNYAFFLLYDILKSDKETIVKYLPILSEKYPVTKQSVTDKLSELEKCGKIFNRKEYFLEYSGYGHPQNVYCVKNNFWRKEQILMWLIKTGEFKTNGMIALVNENGTIDVVPDENVKLYGNEKRYCKVLPIANHLPEYIRFGVVDGDFYYTNTGWNSVKNVESGYNGGLIEQHDIVALEGCPEIVTGTFHCEKIGLTSLKGGPQKVWGDFIAKSNKLTSFVGMPKYIGGCFNVANNEFDDAAWEFAKENIDGEFCDYNIANNKFVKYRKELY